MPTVLIAPDKFKGTLTAAQVAGAVEAGICRAVPETRVVCVPVADGGDGTVAAAIAAGFLPVPVRAAGPTGKAARTIYARRNETAVVEMAEVCGLGRLPGGRLEPLMATSRGVGEVISAAVRAGCRHVVLGVGGSASTDGGAGLVRALGARLLDAEGGEIADGGAALALLERLDLSGMSTSQARITLACDVDNPLTGPRGAAAVYGPQKGADDDQVNQLDHALGRWADKVAEATGNDERERPGTGAAGGVGFAALALLGAQLRPGIDLVLDLVGFHQRLTGVDLVITGEGSLDGQTLCGKAPAGVAAAARAAGIPVLAVCGKNSLGPSALAHAGLTAAYALSDLEPDEQQCMREGARLLEQLGEQIATDHLMN